MRYYTPAKKCKLDSAWIGPYLIVSLIGWALGKQKDSSGSKCYIGYGYYVGSSCFCPHSGGKPARIDPSCVIHQFCIHKIDSGPVRLMTIAHAFNYRVAVKRDGVRSAVRVGRSRKAETCFLGEVNMSWGQQVTVMFQIVSTLMEEVPAFALRMRELQGESPDVQLQDDPWGHVELCDANCACLNSDQTDSYIHSLLPRPNTSDLTPRNDDEISGVVEDGFMFNNDCVGRQGC